MIDFIIGGLCNAFDVLLVLLFLWNTVECIKDIGKNKFLFPIFYCLVWGFGLQFILN